MWPTFRRRNGLSRDTQAVSRILTSDSWPYSDIWLVLSQRIECVPDSSVGIATRYVLAGHWIEFRWGRDFPHMSRPTLGPTQLRKQWVPGLSRGVALTTHPI